MYLLEQLYLWLRGENVLTHHVQALNVDNTYKMYALPICYLK